MCFRPSAVAGQIGNQIQTGTCPKCGQPVAASIGITGGTCPHCNSPIPAESQESSEVPNPAKDVKIL